MHSTACGVGASSANSANASIQSADGLKMVHSNDDHMNKMPLKSASGLDDEEKNGDEFIHDTATAEEARREQMRANLLKWMKKLTIVLICFIGIALISYVIISLCFSDWPKSTNTPTSSSSSNSSLLSDDNGSGSGSGSNEATGPLSNSTSHGDSGDATLLASSIGGAGVSDKHITNAAVTPTYTTSDAATVNMSGQKASPTASVAASTAKTTEHPPMTTAHMLQDVPITDTKFQSKLGVYEKAAVCSDKEVCSQIGSNILEQGGTAVDSIIATLLCNGIMTMQSMGIGGGMLMNVYIKNNRQAYSIDAREVAPFAAYPEMFDKNYNASFSGGLAIAVPGELMGYQKAHERFGKLPWKALIEPSIKLCHEGFYLSQHQWNSWQISKQSLKNNEVLKKVFLNASTGELHPVGTKLKPHKELCETYALLAKNGPLDFYNGTLSKLIVEDLKELGSTVTSYDLESYGADLVSSITMQLGNDILYSVPPVSSGSVVANILSTLESFNLTKADMADAESEANTIHRIAEALKFGFAKRWELGDVRFNDVRELVSKLTNPETGISIHAQINETHVLNSIYDYGVQFIGGDDFGTSHAVVLAPNGDAVSVTSSVNDYFGSGQTGKRTGIIFNSCMNDFSIEGKTDNFALPASPSNFIEARKRPMSSMSPMILADTHGDVHMAFGAAGGSKIISAVVEIAARVLWLGQDIKQAIDAPRFHHQLIPNILELQAGCFSEEIKKLLEAKGHKTVYFKSTGSNACGIVRNETAIYANSDYRKRGGIAGF